MSLWVVFVARRTVLTTHAQYMPTKQFLTPAGQTWSTVSATHLREGSAIRACLPETLDDRFISESLIIALVAKFQAFGRDLFAYGAGRIAVLVGGGFGAVIKGALVEDSRLTRGNASSGNLAIEFRRFGIDVWDVLATRGIDSVQLRRDLNRVNDLRNALAHGQAVERELMPVAIVDVFRVFAQLDGVAALLDDVMATHLVTLEHESWRADGYE